MLTASQSSVAVVMTSHDEAFFKALGARIAEFRKEQGLSQQALADELGIPQQTFAHYEVGRTRMPVSLLPELAKLFAARIILSSSPSAKTTRFGDERTLSNTLCKVPAIGSRRADN